MTVLMLLGSGDEPYRRYMLEAISRNFAVVLLATEPVTWESPFVCDHVLVESGDVEDFDRAARLMSTKYDVGGVGTYHEPHVHAAGVVAERLGLPRCPAEALRLCRDKYGTRLAFAESGIPSAAHALVRSLPEATGAAEDIGYPVVVKPRALSAGFGVSLVREPSRLAEAFYCARESTLAFVHQDRGDVLIGEYLDGPEISIDCCVREGRTFPLLFAAKQLGHPPFFEELGHVVAPASALGLDVEAVTDVLERAHRALGVDNVVTHVELRLTALGPKVVEVNGRPGGDLIPYLGSLAVGIDESSVAADLMAGREPCLTRHGDSVAGVRFFYPPRPGRLRRIRLADDFGNPRWLRRLTWLARPGDHLTLPPETFHDCRVGLAVVTASTREQCEERLDLVAAAVRVVMNEPSCAELPGV